MFDLYLFNTIINALWYLFTVLFVLYKYTKFFTYIYNFVRFCGKLVTGASYVYSFINPPPPQVDLEAQYLQENRNKKKTLYSKCKGYLIKNYNYYYRKFFKTGTFTDAVDRRQGTFDDRRQGNYNTSDEYNEYSEYSELTVNRNNQNVFPLVETNYGSGIDFSTQLHKSNGKRENDMFNKKIQELEVSELEIEENNCYIKNENENYIFRIGEKTSDSDLKDKILLNENFKTDFIKSRESLNAFTNNAGTFDNRRQGTFDDDVVRRQGNTENLSNVNLDEFYSDSDIEIDSDTELPSDLFM
jgi:hypothetical protein